MPVGAAITGAFSLGTALIGSHAASTAAGQQVAAGQQAAALQAPAINARNGALQRLANLYGLGDIGTTAGPAAATSTAKPPIPAGSGILPPGNASTGFLTQYGPGWAAYPTPGAPANNGNSSSFTNTVG